MAQNINLRAERFMELKVQLCDKTYSQCTLNVKEFVSIL